MDRSTLARAILDTAKLTGNFVLRSGRTATTYFDKYLFESDPATLRAVAEQLATLVPGGTEVLCGLEMGGIPVVAALSQVTGLPCAFLRKQRKEYGTMKFAEGPALQGRRIILVEDVVSSGGAILDQVGMLRSDGVDVNLAICVIDRQSGGVEALAEAGVTLRALFTMAEIGGSAR